MCDRSRERIDAQYRNMITAERINVLQALLNEGRNGSDTLAATLQDLKNGNRPLSTRLGRGFTA
jgi:hypothetical protein